MKSARGRVCCPRISGTYEMCRKTDPTGLAYSFGSHPYASTRMGHSPHAAALEHVGLFLGQICVIEGLGKREVYASRTGRMAKERTAQ
jgi:hypothetical protein